MELKERSLDYTGDIAKYANNKKISDNLRDIFPYPYTKSDAESYIGLCISSGDTKQLCRAILVDGTAVGGIGIFIVPHRHKKFMNPLIERVFLSQSSPIQSFPTPSPGQRHPVNYSPPASDKRASYGSGSYSGSALSH